MFNLKVMNRWRNKRYKATSSEVPVPRIKFMRDGVTEYLGLNEENQEGTDIVFLSQGVKLYPTPAPTPIMDSLVCWLDGRDGNNVDKTAVWVDRSGNGNNATLYNFGFTSTSGWTGSGLKFNGTNNYAKILDFADIAGKNTCTVIIDFEEVELSGMHMFYELGEGNDSDINTFFSTHEDYLGGKVVTVVAKKTSADYGARASDLGDTNFKSIATITKRTGNATDIHDLFYDGLKKNTIPFGTGNANTSLVNWGRYNFNLFSRGGRDFFLKCTVKSIKIYDRALTEAEILHNYEYELNK